MTDTIHYSRNDEMLVGQAGDETFMLSVATGRYFALNETATRVWQILDQPRTEADIISTLVGAAAFTLMAVPSLPVMYAASVAIGVGLGIAATLTISGIVAVAPPEARATAMTMRITGNRLGPVLMPLVAGLIAAATGVAGILLLTAGSLTACALGMRASRPRA